MTVSELIARLKKFPPLALVALSADAEGNSYDTVRVVEQADDLIPELRLTRQQREQVAETGLVVIWP
jgi:hypothetical protein